jgi:hypothetical protein
MEKHVEKQIADYIMGRLSPEETAHFDDHYLSCETCLSAVHDVLHQQDFLDRFILKNLSSAESEFMERHLLVCRKCFQELQVREKIVLGLREAARLNEIEFDEIPAAQPGIWERLQTLIVSPAFALGAAALALILIYPAWLGMVKLPQLEKKITQWLAPQTFPQSFPLTEGTRDSTSVIRLPNHQSNQLFTITFTILEKTHPPPRYRAQIVNVRGQEIWRGDAILPTGEYEVFSIHCQSAYFQEENYEVRLFEVNPENMQATREFVFPFRIEFIGD